jgi:hypothetical protein
LNPTPGANPNKGLARFYRLADFSVKKFKCRASSYWGRERLRCRAWYRRDTIFACHFKNSRLLILVEETAALC